LAHNFLEDKKEKGELENKGMAALGKDMLQFIFLPRKGIATCRDSAEG